MSLAQSTIEFILFDKLRSYHTPGTAIDTKTQFDTVLSSDTTIGISAQQIFQNSCRYVIFINGGGKKSWPDDWLKKNCETLAQTIFQQQPGAAVPPANAATPSDPGKPVAPMTKPAAGPATHGA